MARRKKGKLTDKRIGKCLRAKGRYPDGDGLYLQVGSPGSGSWLLRYELHGRERFMGLGALNNFRLKEARERARKARQLLTDGIDPLEARRAERRERQEEAGRTKTFREVAEMYYDIHAVEWKNTKSHKRFTSTMRDYVYPVLGNLPVSEIDSATVLRVFDQKMLGETFWRARPDTAKRVRQFMYGIFSLAATRGYRAAGANPADWQNTHKHNLPRPSAIRKVEHHPALPFAELHAFVTDLRQREGVAARALEFCILTAARTGEVTGAPWAEIDMDEKIWTIPAERMKAKRDHRVPLCDRAIAILKSLPREKENPYAFIGGRKAVGLSNMAMATVLKRMKRTDITVHGFRSTFRDWAAERTTFPNHVVEMALAHTVGNGVEAAYRRGDLLQKRVQLMNAWAKYAESKPVADSRGESVIAIGRARQ